MTEIRVLRKLRSGGFAITAAVDYMFLRNGYRNAFEQFSKIPIRA
jgi:hypothetical protein